MNRRWNRNVGISVFYNDWKGGVYLIPIQSDHQNFEFIVTKSKKFKEYEYFCKALYFEIKNNFNFGPFK